MGDRFLEVDIPIFKSFEKLFNKSLMVWPGLADVAANIGKCKGDFLHIFLRLNFIQINQFPQRQENMLIIFIFVHLVYHDHQLIIIKMLYLFCACLYLFFRLQKLLLILFLGREKSFFAVQGHHIVYFEQTFHVRLYQKGEIYIFAVVFVTAELSDHYCVFAVVEGDVAEVEQEGGVFQHFGAEEVAEEDIFAGGWFVNDRVGAVGHGFSGVRFDPGGDD